MSKSGTTEIIPNARLMLEYMVGNTHDLPMTLTEIITNAVIDAQASKICIKVGNYGEGNNTVPAILFMDDGIGFNKEKLLSVLNYGKSSHTSERLAAGGRKLVGRNGTGIKSLLGLGNKDEARVHILTRSDTYPEGMYTEFDFEHLERLFGERKPVLEECISFLGNRRGLMYQGWKRERGTTIALTGFDQQIISGNEVLIEALSQYISPRMASKVHVFIGGKFFPLQVAKLKGKRFTHDFDDPRLGKVLFDVYYGEIHDGPLICGEESTISNFRKFWNMVPQQAKAQMGKIWTSLGGYVYVPGLTEMEVRMHDGTLKKEFFGAKSKPFKDLVTMFQMVGEEIAKSQEEIKDQEYYNEMEELLVRVSKITSELDDSIPPAAHGDGPKTIHPVEIGSSVNPVCIVPVRVAMTVNSEKAITLNQLGTNPIDFTAARWRSLNSNITVVGNGKHVNLLAGPKTGTFDVEVKGYKTDFLHNISVTVHEKRTGPYIEGDSLINPGTQHVYEVNNADGVFKWEITETPGCTLAPGENNHKIILQVHPKTPNQQLVLFCLKQNGEVVAKKKIRIVDQSSARELVTVIAGHKFLLRISTAYPSCAVQVESPGDEGMPVICVNVLHSQIKEVSQAESINTIANGIGATGLFYLVEQNKIPSQKASSAMWEYVETLKSGLLKRKKV